MLALAAAAVLRCAHAQQTGADAAQQNTFAALALDTQLRWAARHLSTAAASPVPTRVVREGESWDGATPCGTLALGVWGAASSAPLPPGVAPMQEGGVPLPPQSFALRCVGGDAGERAGAGVEECARCFILGGDGVGVMYGALHVADQWRAAGGDAHSHPLRTLRDAHASPYIPQRGLKMNIPLDARTPSYSDCGDSAQANMRAVWDPTFWASYFDAMVRMRYNSLSLWAPHPFPSLVRVPEYPKIGYDDVAQAAVDWRWVNTQCERTGANVGLAPAILNNLTTLVRMPLDEKVAFWQNVTASAAALGIQVYWITWSVFTGEAGHGMPDVPNNVTAAYVRATTRAFLRTYPHVAGLGVTAGENMTGSDEEKEAWLWEGYGQGVNDAMAAQPGRQLTFLHRVWETAMAPIESAFAGLDPSVNFDFSFKYCAARCYTVVKPAFWAQANLSLPVGAGERSKFWWNLRNDDVFTYRWGDVEFLRTFITSLPPTNTTRGFWFGSDGYVWGREFTSLRPSTPTRQLEVNKHWLAHTAWGLLGYDPTTPSSVFAALAAERYPEAPSPAGPYMLSLSATASTVVPTINQFYWQDWDVEWNAEICSRSAYGVASDTAFVTVLDFAGATPLAGSGMVSIGEWVKNSTSVGLSPLQVAEGLEAQANATLAGVSGVQPGGNVELQETLGDYTALSALGLYYACKIRGAAYAALYVAGGRTDKALQGVAVAQLRAGAQHWSVYAAVTYAQYAVQAVFARVGVANLTLLQAEVEADVALVQALG